MTTTVRKYHYSRQREVIYRLLAATASHPTAEWIYTQAREELPQISLGTVYRNLQILRDQGRIRELQFTPGQARYDAMMDPHQHFICSACGLMVDIHVGQDLPLGHIGGLPPGAAIEQVHVELFGLCPDCAR